MTALKIIGIIAGVILTSFWLMLIISVGEINNVVELIAGIISAIGLLILAIKKLLQKKDTTKK